ncbi:hypothetical protein, partial [Neisseria sicca]|uniref:hypothetical protein n=1 Tax=Neisseria sicca TaxID=490 RepID=UPI001C9903D5
GEVGFVVGGVRGEQVGEVGLGWIEVVLGCGLTFSGKVGRGEGGVGERGNERGSRVDEEGFVGVGWFGEGNLVGEGEGDGG